jgi:TonB family protein
MRIALLLPLTVLSHCGQPAADSDVKAFVPFLHWSTRVEPVWPTEARSQGLQSEIQLLVKLDTAGSVVSAEPLTGPTIFRQAAIDAVRQWRFRPVIREGRAVIAMTTETIDFREPGQKFQPPTREELERAADRSNELTYRFPRTASQVLADLEQSLVGASAIDREPRLPALAKAAIRAGDLSKAVSYADESLSSASHDGDAVHDGNLVLGLVALKNRDIVNARIHLLKAGESTGSPVLRSFGPNMTLAKALLEAGQRDDVLQYFDQCRAFWQMGSTKLDEWSATVRGGGTPDFGANLLY